jgi:hypothetical protein
MAFSSLGRRQPSKNIGILANTHSDINISPFEEGAAIRAENGNIGAFPGPGRALPVLNGFKFLTQSLTKEAADSLHPVYNRCAHGRPLDCLWLGIICLHACTFHACD